ncbi:MAG: hypothetical protein J6X53_03480 [Abditibacteriota bacterium]|nr:hypothetical protein [Abditibacteriota bacterium]
MAYQCKILSDEAIRAIDESLANGRTLNVFPTKDGVRIVETRQKEVYKSGKKPVDKRGAT